MQSNINFQLKIRNRLIVILISLLVLVLFCESGLRAAGLGWGNFDSGWGKQLNHIYGWDLRPNYRGTFFDWVTGNPGKINPKYRRTIRINSEGFRDDHEFSLSKPKGTYRIIVMGDSAAFGWGIESEDTYAKKLERQLNDMNKGVRFEVINAGVPGHTSFQALPYWKHKLSKYNPDLVVITFGWSDYMNANLEDKYWINHVSPLHTKLRDTAFRSRVLQGLSSLQDHFKKKYDNKKTFRVSLKDIHTNIINLVKSVRSQGAEPILMTIQSKLLNNQISEWTLKSHSIDNNKENTILRHKQINSIIRNIGKEMDVNVVDIAKTFLLLQKNGSQDIYYRSEESVDDMHPSEIGHSIIANELFAHSLFLLNENKLVRRITTSR